MNDIDEEGTYNKLFEDDKLSVVLSNLFCDRFLDICDGKHHVTICLEDFRVIVFDCERDRDG